MSCEAASDVTAPALSSVSTVPASLVGGHPAVGTVTLTGPAPQSGLTVTLASNNAAATLPATVAIASGDTKATFPVTTGVVTATTSVTISATYNAVAKTSTLTISPPKLQDIFPDLAI